MIGCIGIAVLALIVACQPPGATSPTVAAAADSLLVTGVYDDDLWTWLGCPTGRWRWRWDLVDAARCTTSGHAELLVIRSRYQWVLRGWPPCTVVADLRLVPADTLFWHTLRTEVLADGSCELLPLCRQPLESTAYADLLSLLRQLTTSRFAAVVTHWPSYPVPVRATAATCENSDLIACLREALARWNDDRDPPLFVWNPGESWGVRLVHFPGTFRSPPLESRVVRLDAAGRPSRIHILVGDDYQGPRDLRYATRGFVHELGHALFLWGHSVDRRHTLWGAAPPQVDEPSRDERNAVELWLRLPAGLQLANYAN